MIRLCISFMIIVSMMLSWNGVVYASDQTDGMEIERGISKMTINAVRSTTTKVSVTAKSLLTEPADSIKTTATLYEYNSSTGSLTTTGKSVTKTDSNCSNYSFSTSFAISAAKTYKVKLEVVQTINGSSNKGVYYSNEF